MLAQAMVSITEPYLNDQRILSRSLTLDNAIAINHKDSVLQIYYHIPKSRSFGLCQSQKIHTTEQKQITITIIDE